ncbi:MAG: 3'-5' exonuclease, partial [Cryomorphaceae bacterium]
RVVRNLSDNEEGLFVANDIFQEKNNAQLDNKSFAILYRTNSQSRSMEEALRKLNIPYRIYGGQSFYQRKEIKDLLAYYRLTANPNDEESLKRVINYPTRGIGKTTLEKITIKANEQDKSMWEVMTTSLNELEVNSGTKNKIANFTTMMRSFSAQLQSEEAATLAEHIAKSTGLLRELYADKTPEGLSRFENIQELLNGIKEFTESERPEFEGKKPTLSEFLLDVALLTDADQNDDDDNKVSLMTIHASKGLEFPYVYIVGMEENLFPSQLSLNERSELEEERRLFYVALTRAEVKVTLTYAMSRYKYGSLNYCEPSRFIDEIDTQYVDLPAVEERKAPTSFDETPWGGGFGSSGGNSFARREKFKRKTDTKPQTPQPSIPKNLKKVSQTSTVQGSTLEPGSVVVGTKVAHAKFGKGKVVNIEGEAPNEKATVFFPTVGQKQLLLKFAKLEIVE